MTALTKNKWQNTYLSAMTCMISMTLPFQKGIFDQFSLSYWPWSKVEGQCKKTASFGQPEAAKM